MQAKRDKSTIENVLSMLEKNRGSFVSGADMAQSIGVSRNAIWKAINELRKSGYVIESVTNRGYRLSEDNDIISAEGIRAYMDTGSQFPCDNDVFVYDCLDSTNDKAKGIALKGGKHGTCIVALAQSGGRGRKDHLFYSPKGGIYMSMILKPDRIPFCESDIITAHVGISVCKVIESLTGRRPYIQGINDLYIDGKKICGILIEAGSEFDSGTLQWIVAGIGINFDSDIRIFPKELKDTAASLYEPGKAEISKNRLIATIIENISMIETADEKSVMKEYAKWRNTDRE